MNELTDILKHAITNAYRRIEKCVFYEDVVWFCGELRSKGYEITKTAIHGEERTTPTNTQSA